MRWHVIELSPKPPMIAKRRFPRKRTQHDNT
jgi:hypothetical protein